MFKYWTIFLVSIISSGLAYYQGYDYTPPQFYWYETPTTYHTFHHSYEYKPDNHDFGSAYHNYRPAHHSYESTHHKFGPSHHAYHSHNQPCYHTQWDTKSDLNQWWEDTPTRWSWDNGGDRPTYPWPPATTSPPPAPSWPDRVDKPTSNLPGVFETCVRSCRTTAEYNPVCGTDGVTYINPSRLKCAIECGANVQLARPYKCDQSFVTTPKPTPSTPSAEGIRQCMLTCPVTSEYNPVCGSNGVTYANPSRLECAKGCGLDVRVAYRSRCGVGVPTSTSQPPTSPTTSSTTVSSSEPPSSATTVSSSEPPSSATTVSSPEPPSSATPPETPSTATPSSTTLSSVTPPPTTPTTEKDAVTSTTDNGLGFTIPKEILDSIFTEDPDYSGVIDERHE